MKGKVTMLTVLLLSLPINIFAEIGTVKIKNVSVNSSSPTQMGDAFYFPGHDSVNGHGLWKSDGTSEGTVLIKQFTTERPEGLFNANGTLYFCGHDTTYGWELWKSDGTPSGTTRFTDLAPGAEDGVSDIYCIFSYLDGKVFFPGNNGSAADGWALWKTDGTIGNTVMVHDLQPSNIWGLPTALFVMENTLIFTGNDGVHGYEWWKCEGPDYNTASMIADIYPGIWSGINEYRHPVLNGSFYFEGNDGGVDGRELWRSDGTEAGTEMVKDINPSGDGRAFQITAVNETIFFKADNGTDGFELWKSDGTESGTVMVKNIHPSDGSNSDYYTAIGESLYFTADDGTYGNEVWKTDGTESGTVRITDINTSGDSDPRDLTLFGTSVFFRADDQVTGDELWMTDGSAGNANLVADIIIGAESSWPRSLFVFNDALYFSATYDNSAPEGEGDGLYRYGEIISTQFSWNLFLPAILSAAKK